MARSDFSLHRKLGLSLILSFAPLTHGSLWESGNWALTGALNGSAGYDSNPTVNHDGQGAAFFQSNPVLTFARRDSSTDFRIDSGVTTTNFASGRLTPETDLKFDTVCSYPNAENVIPLYRAEAAWLRSSPPNEYLGARVRTEQQTFSAEGYLPVTGKLGIRSAAHYAGENYDSAGLNQIRRGDIFLGLAYEHDPRTEISFNLGAALGHAQPNDPLRIEDDVHSAEYYATTRWRGELTAKVSGDAFVGLGRVDYTGGYAHSNTLPVGGVDLTWAINPHRKLVLAASSGASFAPDGQTGRITRASLTFTQEILVRWQYELRFGPAHSVYGRASGQRTDDNWDVGMEFAYQPSQRFRVALAMNYTEQNSDKAFAQFTRNFISLGAAYRL